MSKIDFAEPQSIPKMVVKERRCPKCGRSGAWIDTSIRGAPYWSCGSLCGWTQAIPDPPEDPHTFNQFRCTKPRANRIPNAIRRRKFACKGCGKPMIGWFHVSQKWCKAKCRLDFYKKKLIAKIKQERIERKKTKMVALSTTRQGPWA